MKKVFGLLLILIFLSPTLSLYSQADDSVYPADTTASRYLKLIIRSVPSLTIEVNGHYDFGVYELSANDNGDFSSTEFIDGENFGVRHGFGASAVAKFPLHQKGYLRLCVSGSYSRFSSRYNKVLEEQNEGGYANYNVFTFGVGMENSFTPSYKFKPLVGISIIGSLISGNARVFDPKIFAYRDLSIIPAFRLGLMVYSGLEYLVSNRFGLNCGIKFVHANLWLKDSKVSDNPNEIYLNDKRVTTKIPFAGWRQFAWGSFYGGVNIYFGINQKDFKIKKILN